MADDLGEFFGDPCGGMPADTHSDREIRDRKFLNNFQHQTGDVARAVTAGFIDHYTGNVLYI